MRKQLPTRPSVILHISSLWLWFNKCLTVLIAVIISTLIRSTSVHTRLGFLKAFMLKSSLISSNNIGLFILRYLKTLYQMWILQKKVQCAVMQLGQIQKHGKHSTIPQKNAKNVFEPRFHFSHQPQSETPRVWTNLSA